MPESVVLSDEVVLYYVLRDSGILGRLTSGQIVRRGPDSLAVFDHLGTELEYFSGERLRSWCVFGPDGTALNGWRKVLAQDLSKVPPRLEQAT
jgi:hypothetical protein